MLYKFKSKTTGDLILLEPAGRRVLEIIGKEPKEKGIILAAQIPAALTALEAALVREDALDKQVKAEEGREAEERDDANANADAVTLRQRVKPFVDMLRRCDDAGVDVVWGV